MKVDVVHNKSCQKMDEISNDSIDCILTSPPYWGLRDYGDDVKEIWGGNKNCEHQWIKASGGLIHENRNFITGTQEEAQGKRETTYIFKYDKVKSSSCQLCGAWHGQLGLEPTFQLYLDHLMIVCAEVKRVLKETGSFWLNMGDTYLTGKGSCKNPGGGSKSWKSWNDKKAIFPRGRAAPNRMSKELPPKCLAGIPWRLVLRLVDEQGWILRNAIIWNKPNHMPSSVKDRCSNGYEFLFHLVKEKKYYYDLDVIREKHKEISLRRIEKPLHQKHPDNIGIGIPPVDTERMRERFCNPSGKNPGDVWVIPTQSRPEAHFACFPDKLTIRPILATCPAEICRKCGKPRVRITKRDSYITRPTQGRDTQKHKQKPEYSAGLARTGGHVAVDVETIGWTDCGCNAGWDSGILLDPFAGRGTALIMAKKLGRHYVGYELKKEYVDKLIEPILTDIDPLFRESRK